jgi:hypothetical protein
VAIATTATNNRIGYGKVGISCLQKYEKKSRVQSAERIICCRHDKKCEKFPSFLFLSSLLSPLSSFLFIFAARIQKEWQATISDHYSYRY